MTVNYENQSSVSFHAKFEGTIVMIGLGSIGRAVVPLLQRHLDLSQGRLIALDPNPSCQAWAERLGIEFRQIALTKENYRHELACYLAPDQRKNRGFCLNLSVEVDSLALTELCLDWDVPYLDTVIETWPGFYYNADLTLSERSNYRLREDWLTLRQKKGGKGTTTAVSCCGANPGMVSWLVKHALVNLAKDVGHKDLQDSLGKDGLAIPTPGDRPAWAKLMQSLGVKGIHVAERDSQTRAKPRLKGQFLNTWSVDGLISEGMQPAELGWGSHEKWYPSSAVAHDYGGRYALMLNRAGADTRVRTWVPSHGPQFGLLITHNEALSIADYYSVCDGQGKVIYRPTCHYAYRPSDAALASLYDMFGAEGTMPSSHDVMDADDIFDEGEDELGVLLYGHPANLYWYGSRLSMGEARRLAPWQNATGMQVSSAVLAGVVWAIENPYAGMVEADEMDYLRCIAIQRPYLGRVEGHYSDWTPIATRNPLFTHHNIDKSDPWQFRNILVDE